MPCSCPDSRGSGNSIKIRTTRAEIHKMATTSANNDWGGTGDRMTHGAGMGTEEQDNDPEDTEVR
jgi:hypothetical protein